MANVMTYNGETITNLNLVSIATVAEYAPGGVQKAFNRTTIQFEGSVGRTTAPGTPAEFALNIDQVRRNLMKPRQDLVISLAGSDLFNITAPDDANGPKPIDIDLTPVYGSSYALVTGTIEITVAECDYTGETPNAIASNIVSHNYSVTHSMDDLFLTTRTVTGRIVIRQGVQLTPDDVSPTSTTRKDNPDLLRGLITPRLPQGFKRESMTFVVSDDGLMLDYDIRDVEIPITPPSGALRASGSFVQSVQIGSTWISSVSVEIEGPKNKSKAQMFQLAMAVAQSKVPTNGADGKESIIQSATIASSLYSNKIAIQLVAKSWKVNAINNVFPTTGFARTFSIMKGSESGKAEDLGPYGSATVNAAKQRFFDPCTTDMTSESNQGATVYQGMKGGGKNVSVGPAISVFPMPATGDPGGSTSESGDSKLDASQIVNGNNFDYTTFNETISTKSVNGLVILPGTSNNSPAKTYQRHAPYLQVSQQGRAIRNGLPPDVPTPLTGTLGEVRGNDVINHEPRLSADQTTFIYSTSWNYDIIRPIPESELTTAKSGVVYVNTFDNPTQIPLNVVALPLSDTKLPVQPFDPTPSIA